MARWGRSAVVIWGTLCALAPAARAQDEPAAAPAAQDPKAQARVYFERGVKAFEAGTWDVALAEFLESRSLFPTARNTQNAAVCLKKLGRTDEALELFQKYREFQLSAEESAAAMQEIAELERSLGTVEVSISESGATLQVDGRERGVAPVPPLRLRAGTHTLRAYKEGFAPAELVISVASGSNSRQTLTLRALEQAGRITVTEDTGAAADVLVDNVVVGKTPWRGSAAPGDHVVLLRGAGARGSQPAQARVRVNEVTTLTLALEELPAVLRVEPVPQDAVIALDGVTLGQGRWEGRVRAGAHNLEVAALGFVAQRKRIETPAGASEQRVALERDLSHPLWAQSAPNRVFLEGGLLAPVWLVRGQGGSCDGACSSSIPLGVGAFLGVGYQLRSGFAFALDVQYNYGAWGRSARSVAFERPFRPDVEPGRVDERVDLHALVVGVSGRYRFHEGDWPLTVVLGTGLLAGSVRTRQDLELASNGANVGAVQSSTGITGLYVRPELRGAFRPSARTELFAGIAPSLLVGLSHAQTPKASSLPLPSVGFGALEGERIMGGVMFGVSLSVGVKHEF
jgi:hypothetical protein